MPCLAFKLPSTGSTTTSGSGAPNDRRPTSSDKTENCSPRSAMACSSSNTTASAARSSSIVLSPPAPIASCCRPASVPASGETTSRTRPPIRRNVSSQARSEEHTSELQSQSNLVCRLLLEKKKKKFNAVYLLEEKRNKISE